MARPRSEEDKTPVHLRTPDWLLKAVDEIARDRNVTRSRVMLDAVRDKLRIKPPARRSVLKTPPLDEPTLPETPRAPAWTVPVKLLFDGVASVEAASAEEAAAKIEAGEFEHELGERVKWKQDGEIERSGT